MAVTRTAGRAGANGGGRDRAVVFLHIGKTGGMSLRQVIRRQFRRKEVLSFHALPGEGDASGGRPPREATLDWLAARPEVWRSRLRLVEGHTIFGIHELLPVPSTYVTMLRDPVARVISGYRYILRRPNHPHYEPARRLGLEGFLRSDMALQLDNGQVRAIAGDRESPAGGCTREMLARAEANIERHFAVAGLTERFDETVLLLGRGFGWTDLRYVRANTAPAGPREPVDPRTRDLIEGMNGLDLELCDFVARRMDAAIAADPLFERDLKRFRARNAAYRPFGELAYSLPRRIRARVGRSRSAAAGAS